MWQFTALVAALLYLHLVVDCTILCEIVTVHCFVCNIALHGNIVMTEILIFVK